MKKHLLAAAIICLAFNTAPSYAWYGFGHEAVAAIAWNKLNPSTKERVMVLLAKNPYYSGWVAHLPPGATEEDRNLLIFAQSSTWADAIKQDHGYHADGAEGGNKPDSPACAENIGYTDTRLHKYWHYDDTPFSPDHTNLPPHVAPNAQTQIETLRKVLASDSPDDLKSYDLVWLIHLVGDVHQPLHCVTRVIHDDPYGDKGGNDCKVNGKPDNIHSIWDGIVGDARELQPAIDFAKSLPDAPKSQAKKSDEKIWIAESVKLARKSVYTKPIGKTNGPFELTEKYKQQARKIGEQRIELAGARLADLLNTELK